MINLQAGRLPLTLPALVRLEAGRRPSRFGTLKCPLAYDDRSERGESDLKARGIDEGGHLPRQVRGLDRP